MCSFSKEFLYRECVMHHHCILIRLKHSIQWDDVEVNEIYMVDMCLDERKLEQILANILNKNNTSGNIEVKAFILNESPANSRLIALSTDDILEIEMRTL